MLVVSVDFLSDVSLRPFLDKAHVDEADVACVLSSKAATTDNAVPPGGKGKKLKSMARSPVTKRRRS